VVKENPRTGDTFEWEVELKVGPPAKKLKEKQPIISGGRGGPFGICK